MAADAGICSCGVRRLQAVVPNVSLLPLPVSPWRKQGRVVV